MLKLQKRFTEEMIAHAREDDPNECCGILAGSNGEFQKLFRMTNVDASPFRFSWDSNELFQVWREMEDQNWNHQAVYHSHTHSPAYPSETDVRMAGWPHAYYIIISLANKDNPVIRAFRIVDGNIREKDVELV